MRAPATHSRGRFLLPALLVLLLLAGTAAALAYLWLERSSTAPGPAAAASRIEVEPGASLRTVLVHLEQAGTLANARAVQWYLRLKGLHVKVESGLYEIPAHASAQQILTLFAEGKVVLEQLTVVEGATFAEFMEVLAAQPHVAHSLRGRTPGGGDGRARAPGRGGRRAVLPGHLPLRRRHQRCGDPQPRLRGHAARARRRLGGARTGPAASRSPTRR